MTNTSPRIRAHPILSRLCRFGMKITNKKAATISGMITQKNQAEATDSFDSGCIAILGMTTKTENTAPAKTSPIPAEIVSLEAVSLSIENPSL
jgi:hypothetical protein